MLLGRSDALNPEELDLLAENLGGGTGVTFRLSLSDSGAGRRRESTQGVVPFAVELRPGEGSYLLLFQRALRWPRGPSLMDRAPAATIHPHQRRQ